ncbi:SPL family radical SAM protein [Paenibacillus beijingensis]|uniref:DNA photolyase n=1 Tax=Paenibacillus beijingensis TaxID=1126833 RepID=A0A0D5NN96_9BACL|nr:DNA photolyase [Paenibacillus beijingensis]
MNGPAVSKKRPQRWLTKASGYLTGYTHTLNPYSGCTFSCSYCYVRRMPIALFRGEDWGSWLDVKELDEEAFAGEWNRESDKRELTVFMASATDPYQPAEFRYEVTRRLLKSMAARPPAFLLLQTRSPLVLRDLDVLSVLGSRLRVSMTIETDDERMRKAITPYAPPLAARWRALRELRSAGIAVQAAVAPLLPHSPGFAAKLAEAAGRIVVDDYFRGDGSGGRRTEQLRIGELYRQLGLEAQYSPDTADRFCERFRHEYPEVRLLTGADGFMP